MYKKREKREKMNSVKNEWWIDGKWLVVGFRVSPNNRFGHICRTECVLRHESCAGRCEYSRINDKPSLIFQNAEREREKRPLAVAKLDMDV